jgi:hypothetical protein
VGQDEATEEQRRDRLRVMQLSDIGAAKEAKLELSAMHTLEVELRLLRVVAQAPHMCHCIIRTLPVAQLAPC